jgi:hypothetical protein
MNRITLLSTLPFVAILGACSSSKSAPSAATPGTGSGDSGPFDDAGSAGEGGGDDASPNTTPFEATLSGAQVVPVVLTGAKGTAKFALLADNVTLHYDITQNVAGATGVNVHLGAAGENGSVTHAISPVSVHMTGSIMLTQEEQDALGSDKLYVDVQSPMHLGGEIRGQLTAPGAQIFVVAANGARQIPTVQSSYTGHASFVMSPDQANLTYHVVTDAVPTDVRLHRGIGAVNGPVAYPLTVGQTSDGVVQLAASDPMDLQAGRFYLNIVTANNPAGELRGQLLVPGETLFIGALEGANEVPPVSSQASGGAQFVLGADRVTMHYEAVVTGVLPTAAEIDIAPLGQNGPTMYQLTLNQQGALGQMSLSAGDLPRLFGALLYMNVRTASYTSGELRGQLIER